MGCNLNDKNGGPPAHIAIIMDGNGRWASHRGFPRYAGHREGAETLKRITRYCKNIGIAYLTVYALSTENFSRPADEITGIMRLFRHYVKTFDKDPERGSIRVRFIGNANGLDSDLREGFVRIVKNTENNADAINLTIAINYGGRDEIVRAAQRASKLVENGELRADGIDESLFSSLLDTGGIPDPDLIIRAGAEYRVSNFLLWQAAYSEFWFTDTLWPDFSENDIDEAVKIYRQRQRRFGSLAEDRGG
jgi:undecaprenyl diphosphate synthase